LGLVTPYAFKYDFGESALSQFVSTRSDFRTYDLTPSLAWRWCNGLSIGAGLDFIYGNYKMDFNIGTIGSPNGFIQSVQNRWAVGMHAGVLWEIDCVTRVGLNYRSAVRMSLEGKADFMLPPFVENFQALIPIRTTFRLPATLTLSGFHQLDQCWAAMMDLEWTHWKKFHELVFDLQEFGEIITLENFRDTYRVAVGAAYHYNECTLFRFGAAYDRTPVRDALRNLMMPDGDRTWLAIGLQYAFPGFRIELGYAHLFYKYQTINQGPPTLVNFSLPLQSGVFGIVKTNTNIVGIQFTYDL
jgi:long-chain fatty acid transport protein